LAKLRKSHVSS